VAIDREIYKEIDMSHLPWNPIRSVEDLTDDIEDAFWRLVHDKWGGEPGDWRPAVDIYETDDAYFLTADLPGVKPEDMGIEVRRRNIILSGQRCFQISSESRREVRVERVCGRFRREFRLDHAIDEREVEISFDYGICDARLPKLNEKSENPKGDNK